MKEVWVDALDFENYYQVSNLGNIKRSSRLSKNSRSDTYRKLPERLLKISKPKTNRYIGLKLSVEGEINFKDLHVVVLSSFEPMPEPGMEANHINGLKWDCRLLNLEWMTPTQNKNHAIETGLITHAKGEQTSNHKMKASTVNKIWKLRHRGFSYAKISERLKVSKKMVGDVIRGRTWKHIERD